MRELIPVLMLVPYFAPQSHAAMFRAHKLAKYLPEFGYRPIVVTTDINYLYNEDTSLIDELPDEVQVFRARYVEPTLRGIRMAFGGRDRTFAAIKREAANRGETFRSRSEFAEGDSVVSNLYSSVARTVGEWPDRYWTWSLISKRLCERLIKELDIPIIYTSAIPLTPLGTASSLQRRFGLKWIADFRDPAGFGYKFAATGPLSSLLEKRLLMRTMNSADRVTALSDSYGQIFLELFGLPEEKFKFIPTGADEAYLSEADSLNNESDVLLHVGEVMPDQSPYIFEVLACAQKKAPEPLENACLLFVGRREINQPRVETLTRHVSTWNMPIEYRDHVPQSELYALTRGARACLLVPGNRRYWWTNFSKLVDYIALRVPVIAHVPTVSEARTELMKTGQAFFLSGESVEHDADELLRWWQEPAVAKSADYWQRYTARRQVSDFAELFDEVLARS